MHYFVTAIGTDSGKTVASAILTEALTADYWKPIQAGLPKDSEAVKSLLSNKKSTILPEQHVLKLPASPHYAADIDGIQLNVKDFALPKSNNGHLVIEGAGGVLVPINQSEFVIDIAQQLNSPVILVCNLYLGSINHSLLSLQELKSRNINLKGIIFNGEANPASEQIITRYAQVPVLLRIKRENSMNKAVIKRYAEMLKDKL